MTVFNRILLRLQDARLTEKELEEIGFMLRRVWLLGRAYAARKAPTTFEEWIGRLRGVARDSGVALP